MNKAYYYDNIHLWDPKVWENRALPVNNLIQWLGQIDPLVESEYAMPPDMNRPVERSATGFLGYIPETEREFFQKKDYDLELHHIWVAKWISIVPRTAERNSGRQYPTLLIMHQEHIEAAWPAKTLKRRHGLIEEAMRNNMIVLIVVTDGRDVSRQYGNILMEAVSLYPIDYHNIVLDVSAVYESGHNLDQVPGGIMADAKDSKLENPNGRVRKLGQYDLLDISDICKSYGSPHQGQLVGAEGHASGNASYDPQRFIHTLAAERISDALEIEYRFQSHKDPAFIEFWDKKGLIYESHDLNHEQYITLVPKTVQKKPGIQLPIMLIFQEVYYYNDHLPVEATAYWFEYCKIAAQGECMLLFYACEKYEHNKNMYNVFLDVCGKYPIDKTRVYVTGYSHNAQTAARFAYDYPQIITALAGGLPGSSTPQTTDEEQRKINQRHREIDMPCINIVGCCEHNSPQGLPSFENNRIFVDKVRNAILAGNCPERSLEDFQKAYKSADKATRMLGVPNDKSEVLYLEGLEHYIADIKNKEGKFHLRVGSIENAPHNPFPTKQMLEWSFVRRFARNPVTHEITEC